MTATADAPLQASLAPSPRFAGKVAIVTGAGCVGPGWGNGRAIAVRLAEEGAQVLAVDRDPARLDETLARARPLTVVLPRSVPVHFVNLTAWAEAGGVAHFRPDLYGIDRHLGEQAPPAPPCSTTTGIPPSPAARSFWSRSRRQSKRRTVSSELSDWKLPL